MFKKLFEPKIRRKSQLEREPIPPLSFHPHSNGEYVPKDPGPREFAAEKAYNDLVESRRRKLGVSRRRFMESICGLAGGLYVMNSIYACKGENPYAVNEETTWDETAAKEAIGKKAEVIFDGQTHMNNGPGETADFAEAAGKDTEKFYLLAGVRLAF